MSTFTDKIDSVLYEQLTSMNNEDFVNVSIWLTDIDHDIEAEQIENALSDKISSGELPIEVFEVLQLSNIKDLDEIGKTDIRAIDNAFSVEQMQLMISTKRAVSSRIYQETNESKLHTLFTQEQIDKNIDFISHYTPNFTATVQKNNIFQLIESEEVEYIYLENSDLEISDENTENSLMSNDTPSDDTPSEEYSLTTYQYEMTGIDTLRDELGYTGKGIIIGVDDSKISFSDNIDYFDMSKLSTHIFLNNRRVNYENYMEHANAVLAIIAGEYYNSETGDNYVGAVPDADIYVSIGRTFKSSTEYLLDNGVNVINFSRTENQVHNTYNDDAIYIDYINSQHNVHFVGSSGNDGEIGITNPKFSYNSIIVGSCDETGELIDTSSYCNIENRMYKPDITAPGEMVTPAFRDSPTAPYSIQDGTSFAAPIVTGGVAQLCQASTVLACNPRLMKAVIFSGSTINEHIEENDVIKTDTLSANNMFSRQYGAGIFNVYNSYKIYSVSNNTILGYVPNFINNISSYKNLTVSENDLIRVCAVWDKKTYITGNHLSTSVTSLELDPYIMEIITPSGLSYRAYCNYDTKDLVSFRATESGSYQIYFIRATSGSPNNLYLNFAIALSVQHNECL